MKSIKLYILNRSRLQKNIKITFCVTSFREFDVQYVLAHAIIMNNQNQHLEQCRSCINTVFFIKVHPQLVEKRLRNYMQIPCAVYYKLSYTLKNNKSYSYTVIAAFRAKHFSLQQTVIFDPVVFVRRNLFLLKQQLGYEAKFIRFFK